MNNSQINPDNQSLADGLPKPSDFMGRSSRSAVPVFVYQQLVENHQHIQQELEEVKQINQELVDQNQKLRQEIIKILQTAEQVQQNVKFLNIPSVNVGQKSAPPTATNPAPIIPKSEQAFTPLPETEFPLKPMAKSSREPVVPPVQEPETITPVWSENTSQIQGLSKSPEAPVKVKKKRSKPPVRKEKSPLANQTEDHLQDQNTLNGWLLFLAILLIVITAFGAGFVVMRPLLNPPPPVNPPANPQ